MEMEADDRVPAPEYWGTVNESGVDELLEELIGTAGPHTGGVAAEAAAAGPPTTTTAEVEPAMRRFIALR
jgi:hypothetical protein